MKDKINVAVRPYNLCEKILLQRWRVWSPCFSRGIG